MGNDTDLVHQISVSLLSCNEDESLLDPRRRQRYPTCSSSPGGLTQALVIVETHTHFLSFCHTHSAHKTTHTNLGIHTNTSHFDKMQTLAAPRRHRITSFFLRGKVPQSFPPPCLSTCHGQLIRHTIASQCATWKLIVFRLKKRWVRSFAPSDSWPRPRLDSGRRRGCGRKNEGRETGN